MAGGLDDIYMLNVKSLLMKLIAQRMMKMTPKANISMTMFAVFGISFPHLVEMSSAIHFLAHQLALHVCFLRYRANQAAFIKEN